MSEMSQAQQPAGGDADPDPSADIVPGAAESEESTRATDHSDDADDAASAGDDGDDGLTSAHLPGPDLDSLGDDDSAAGSDPMPDVAGTGGG